MHALSLATKPFIAVCSKRTVVAHISTFGLGGELLIQRNTFKRLCNKSSHCIMGGDRRSAAAQAKDKKAVELIVEAADMKVFLVDSYLLLEI